MRINGVEIPRGKRIELSLDVAKLPTRTSIDLPVYVYRSKDEGPTLLLTAGIHGDELNGVEAIRILNRSKQLMPEKGTVIAIPLVNIYGFIQYDRDMPDGKDVNRSFPGRIYGSLASRLAYHISKYILPSANYVVDLHTGGRKVHNHPQIRFTKTDIRSRELASAFAAPFTIEKRAISKSFRSEAFRKDKPYIIYEAGESLRLDDFSIEVAKTGILRVMQYLGMKSGGLSTERISVYLEHSSWLRAKISGLFRTVKKPGERITKHEVLGTLTDPFGATEVKIKAPHDGYIIGLNNIPIINQGDALYHIGF